MYCDHGKAKRISFQCENRIGELRFASFDLTKLEKAYHCIPEIIITTMMCDDLAMSNREGEFKTSIFWKSEFKVLECGSCSLQYAF